MVLLADLYALVDREVGVVFKRVQEQVAFPLGHQLHIAQDGFFGQLGFGVEGSRVLTAVDDLFEVVEL